MISDVKQGGPPSVVRTHANKIIASSQVGFRTSPSLDIRRKITKNVARPSIAHVTAKTVVLRSPTTTT
jgi:hypothetical protein